MAKVIVIYGSTTGNTETLTQSIEKDLKAFGVDVSVKNAAQANPEELKDYDGIILGSSTWGDGELQDDFVSFEEGMKKVRLNGKKAACFGPGDSMYPQFCKAVDILEEGLKKCGAEIIMDSLKIDGDVEPRFNEAKEWVGKIAEVFKE